MKSVTYEGKIVVFKAFRSQSNFCDEAFCKIVMSMVLLYLK